MGDFSTIFVIASILDPRYKWGLFNMCFFNEIDKVLQESLLDRHPLELNITWLKQKKKKSKTKPKESESKA